MEIRDYINLVRKWWWLIALTTLLVAVPAYLISSRSPRQYQAASVLLISQGVTPTSTNVYQDLVTSEQLARSYVERLALRPVLESVATTLGVDLGTVLEARVDVERVRDSPLIRLRVTHTDPELAQQLANTIPEIFRQRNQQQQTERYAETKASVTERIAQLEEQVASIERELVAAYESSSEAEVTVRRLESQLLALRGDEDAEESEIGEVEEALFAANAAEEDAGERVRRLETDEGELKNQLGQARGSLEQIRLMEAISENSILLEVPATRPTVPVAPRPLRTALQFALLGLLLGGGLALLIEYLDDTIKANSDLRRMFGLEPLALIGQFEGHAERPLVTLENDRASVAEAYRILRTNIRFASVDEPLRSLVVSSPSPKEGKSSTAANLAVALAQAGHRVILVDADLRRPVQHKIFGISNRAGLTSAIVEREEEVTQFLRPTKVDGLQLLPSGPIPPNPAELVGSQRMREVLALLEQEADYVIVDTAPLLAVADGSLLASFVSGVLLVIRANATKLSSAQRAVEQLRAVQANLLGATINGVPARGDGYYYYYYYHSDNSDPDGPAPGSGGDLPQNKRSTSLTARMRGLLAGLIPSGR